MNHQDAKFRLRAYRPGGHDASDPLFQEALACADRDPALRAWQAREQTWDSLVAADFREIAPPPGLRDAILSGVRLEQRRPSRWRWPGLLAMAASLALVAWLYLRPAASPVAPTELLPQLASWAVNDTRHERHQGLGNASAEFRHDLASPTVRLAALSATEWSRLKPTKCRTLRFAGRDVWEVCFERAGGEYHLYVCRLEDSPALVPASIQRLADASVATWTDARHAFALVSRGDAPLGELL